MKKRHEILFKQLESYRSTVTDVLRDVTDEEADLVPSGFNNNIRWNAGHIFHDQYLWIQVLTREKMDGIERFNDWFGFGTSPSDFCSNTPSLEQLIGLLHEQPSRIREQFGDRLEEEFPPSEMGMHTIEQVLIRTIFHEGMHLQAILDLKKCIRMKYNA